MSLRLIGILLLALVVAAVGGWFVGSAGRSAVERDSTVSLMRAEFAEARALVLEGRVSLFQSNFGEAIQQFQRANVLIGSVQRQLREVGQVEQAGRLQIAISSLGDAQRLAATLDTTKAQASAEQALAALQAASGG
jgi:lipopolysaccharide biosynthesis regulator YciM